MWPYWYDGGSGWWIVMMIGMILFWVVVFVGLYLLYRALVQRGTLSPAAGPTPDDTPRAILDRRLAAGEISSDEYDTLRRKLAE
ncbi:MAG: SHOCT domain-containing protein [Armatimonadota bacterium]